MSEPDFLSECRGQWRHFHFVLAYRDMDDVTKTRKNHGYFIKQIENSLSVPVHDAILTWKILENTWLRLVFSLGIFLVEMRSFMFLPNRETLGQFCKLYLVSIRFYTSRADVSDWKKSYRHNQITKLWRGRTQTVQQRNGVTMVADRWNVYDIHRLEININSSPTISSSTDETRKILIDNFHRID